MREHAHADNALADGAALPDKPSLAVLPFQNMSGDAEQEYFVDKGVRPGAGDQFILVYGVARAFNERD